MPKISDLTVADLRGARDQIEAHLHGRIDTTIHRISIDVIDTGIKAWISLPKGYEVDDHTWISERAEWDADWTEFMDTVWKRIGQIPSREARELRSVMAKLGDSIELLADSPSEFAVTLTARLKALRDEAGARLIEFQPGE